MSAQSQCRSCSTKLQGFLNFHSIIEDEKLKLLNQVLKKNEFERCSKCVTPFEEKARARINNEKKQLEQVTANGLEKLPVVTIQVPPKWDFEILGIVTGQSVTGTGIFSEIFSDFTDFFGAQSGTYNAKLRQGELLCLSQVKIKTLELGGNAVVGVDIDYSEVGGGKGMLMVCMAGTAINLNNISEVQPGIVEALDLAKNASQTLMLFTKFSKAFVEVSSI